jgi:tRNA threonylcarbamoyladenosine biosynthesis protein TsaE
MNTRRSPAVQSPRDLDFISHSPAQTARIGQRLGELLAPGDLVLLYGEFGVGKTLLTQGIVRGLGSTQPVTSPSFVLINEYRAGPSHGGASIYHADLYRLDAGAELEGIGLDDALGGDGICIIEWAERGAGRLPAEHLAIHMQHLNDTKRVLRFVPHGPRYSALVEQFKRKAFA